jgi:hypothetical protein
VVLRLTEHVDGAMLYNIEELIMKTILTKLIIACIVIGAVYDAVTQDWGKFCTEITAFIVWVMVLNYERQTAR